MSIFDVDSSVILTCSRPTKLSQQLLMATRKVVTGLSLLMTATLGVTPEITHWTTHGPFCGQCTPTVKFCGHLHQDRCGVAELGSTFHGILLPLSISLFGLHVDSSFCSTSNCSTFTSTWELTERHSVGLPQLLIEGQLDDFPTTVDTF